MEIGTGPITALFFEPQTGIIRFHDWESNFYHHRIRKGNLGWLEKVVADAVVGSGGLEYPPEVLRKLHTLEQECTRCMRRLLGLSPDRIDDLPLKIGETITEGENKWDTEWITD